MYAFQEIDYTLTFRTVGVFENFKEFLEAYPKMKKFYGNDLVCRYRPKAAPVDEDNFFESET